MTLLDWEEDLLSNEEKIEDGLPEKMTSFLRNALWDRNPERVARAAFEANWLAKEEDHDWYTVKDILLKEFVRLNPQYLFWGMGSDDGGNNVLYIDLPGFGQVSFHVFWDYDDEDVEELFAYPFQWTGVCNDKDLLESPRIIWVLSPEEELNWGNFSPGEKHNFFVQVGADPSPAWETVEEL